MQKKEKWHKIGERSGTVLFFNLISIGIFDKNIKKVLGFKLGVNSFRNYCHEIGYKEKEFNNAVKILQKKIDELGPKYFIDITNNLNNKGLKLAEFCVKLSKKKFKNSSELINALKNMQKLAIDYSPSLVLANTIEPILENNLQKEIETKVKDENLQKKYFNTLTTTVDIDETEEEIEDLRKIKKQSNLKNSINEHVNKWAWLFEGRIGRNKININEFIKKRLDGIDYKLSIKERKKKIYEDSEEIVNQLDLSSDYIKLIKKYVYFRTHRMNLFLKSSYYLSYFFEQIARYLKIDKKLVEQMSFEELIIALRLGKLPNNLNKRLDTSTLSLLSSNGKIIIEIIKKTKEKEIKIDSLRGNIANLGQAKGLVKIVKSVNDLSKVKKGDILVSSMTVPEFVPAMERAAAFITDEGGITCHAAIVSREMNKPCIIGTKQATKVLKDDDLVEVDAIKGIVTILETRKI